MMYDGLNRVCLFGLGWPQQAPESGTAEERNSATRSEEVMRRVRVEVAASGGKCEGGDKRGVRGKEEPGCNGCLEIVDGTEMEKHVYVEQLAEPVG